MDDEEELNNDGASMTQSPARRSSKAHTVLGLQEGEKEESNGGGHFFSSSPLSAESPARRRGTLTSMLAKVTERKRAVSLSQMTAGERREKNSNAVASPILEREKNERVEDAETVALRRRVAELEVAVFELEQKAQEKERALAHWKKKNKIALDQARSIMRALLEGDSRRLDELIRNHYAALDVPSSTGNLPEALEVLSPRSSHLKTPGSARSANGGGTPEVAYAAFAGKDVMFTSHELVKTPTRQSRQSSDPLSTVRLPEASQTDSEGVETKLLLSGKGKSPKPSAGAALPEIPEGTTLVFRPATDELLRASPEDAVNFLVNFNRDRHFLARFLLLFRQFMAPSELLELLRRHLLSCANAEAGNSSAADGGDDALFMFPLPESSSVRQRVGYILRRWMEDHFEEDFENANCAAFRKMFREIVLISGDSSVTVLLDHLLEKAKQLRRNSLVKQGQSMPAMETGNGFSPTLRKPNVPVSSSLAASQIHLLALHPLEVARQMTIFETQLCANVSLLDFLRAAKDSGKRSDDARNQYASRATGAVQQLTARFNVTANWISTQIVAHGAKKERAQYIKFFIQVARFYLVSILIFSFLCRWVKLR